VDLIRDEKNPEGMNTVSECITKVPIPPFGRGGLHPLTINHPPSLTAREKVYHCTNTPIFAKCPERDAMFDVMSNVLNQPVFVDKVDLNDSMS
jgi:hypothetical protein